MFLGGSAGKGIIRYHRPQQITKGLYIDSFGKNIGCWQIVNVAKQNIHICGVNAAKKLRNETTATTITTRKVARHKTTTAIQKRRDVFVVDQKVPVSVPVS